MKTTFIALLMGGCCATISSCLAQFNIVELANPKDLVQANSYVGQQYMEKGNLNGAYLSYKSALYVAKKQKRNTDSCQYNWGVVCLLMGGSAKNAEALEHLEAVKNTVSFKHYWENITIAYIANRQYSEAEEAVQNTDSIQALSWYLRGLLLMQKESFGGAKKAFQKVLRKGIQNLDPLPVAVAFYQTRVDNKSKKEVELMGRLLSNAQRFHHNANEHSWKVAVWLQAMVLAEKGKSSEAIRCLERLSAKDSLVQYAIAYIQFKSGQDSLAQITLKKLINYRRYWSDPYVLLGHIFAQKAAFQNNDIVLWKKATELYSKAIKIKPQPSTFESRALALLRMFDYQKQGSDSCIVRAQGDLMEARKSLGYELAFDTEMAMARAYHYVIYALFFKKYESKFFTKENVKEIVGSAYSGYQNLIKRDSVRVEAYQGMASLELLLSQYDESISNFQNSQQKEHDINNWLGIGLNYYEMEDWKTAGQFFDKVLKKQPKNKTAILGSGLVKWHMKQDTSEAIRQVNQAYLNRDLEKDDVTKATYIFNQARVKANLSFKTSLYPQTPLGFEAYISDSILPLYREAKAITPLADSGAYYVNLGFEAEKFGFRDLAVKWYQMSNSMAGANNLAVLLAKEGSVGKAQEILEGIEVKYALAKKNLRLLKEGKINCGCMKSATFMYMHIGFELGEIVLQTDNKFIPYFENQVSPIKEFASYKKPVIHNSYEDGLLLGGGRKGTNCPKII